MMMMIMKVVTAIVAGGPGGGQGRLLLRGDTGAETGRMTEGKAMPGP